MSRNRWIKATMAAQFACALLVTSAPVAAVETWRAYTYIPSAQLMAPKALVKLFDDISNATRGNVKIRLNVGGSLPIAATNIMQAVSENMVQLGDDAFFVGSIPVSGILQLPVFFRTQEEHLAGYEMVALQIREQLDRKGLVLLASYNYPANVVWSRKKLTSLHDIAGQRIRVISPEQSKFIRALGGIPITMGSSELSTALDRGVIDGMTTATTGSGRMFKETLKYRLNINMTHPTSILYVNKEAWEKLPAAEQSTVMKLTSQTAARLTQELAAEETKATKEMVTEGLTVTDLSPAESAEMLAKARVSWDEWAKERSSQDAKLLSDIRAKFGR